MSLQSALDLQTQTTPPLLLGRLLFDAQPAAQAAAGTLHGRDLDLKLSMPEVQAQEVATRQVFQDAPSPEH